MHKGSLFSTSLSTLAISCLFDNSHSDWYEVISSCGFDLHSLMISDGEHLFMCLLALRISSLENGLFRFFTHLLVRLLNIELFLFLIYFGY